MTDDPNEIHHSALVIDEIRDNPPGRDRRHLDQEYVTFKNDGPTRLDISGWTVTDEADNTFRFPDGTTLAAGERVTLHSGSGTDTDSEFYWGSDRPLWKNLGDTVLVRDADGLIRIRQSYNE
jgi:hypothetical protein